ncbi:hypothetical protein PVNG_05342 [Plasmodium vivax North Korean]|uniref:VIR protein n=1 Tax=Plasmodium vivax North Korean TaxID=1035514 RepID=A0A0J9TZG9_PLAVI|nr:hypothetical protein PVNG_05342 [Plasmodium vivax North Korean]
MLKNEYTTSKKNGKPWCDKYPIKLTTTYPRELTSLSCDETITPESKSADPSPQPVETNCKCPPSEVPVIPLLPVQAPEADRTKNIAVTSGFTAAGTLGTLFFLYRFTPMMSWFRRPGMNNVGTDLYMNPGGAESFISMQQGNGSNNLFYQP